MIDKLINAYDPHLPLRQAVTPPRAWNTDETFTKFENDAIFGENW